MVHARIKQSSWQHRTLALGAAGSSFNLTRHTCAQAIASIRLAACSQGSAANCTRLLRSATLSTLPGRCPPRPLQDVGLATDVSHNTVPAPTRAHSLVWSVCTSFPAPAAAIWYTPSCRKSGFESLFTAPKCAHPPHVRSRRYRPPARAMCGRVQGCVPESSSARCK